MATNMVGTLRSLCEIDPPEVTGQGIDESADRDAFEALCGLGALVHAGNTDSVLCLECDDPHSITAEFTGDGKYRAYCPNTGYRPIKPEWLRRFVINESWVAQSVGAA